MKNKVIFILAPAVLFCWCLFLIQGCKKDPVIEDTTLLTNDDNLSLGKDTLHTKVFSKFEGNLASSGISNGVLGTLTDPHFGSTYAGFFAQHVLVGSNIYFGANPVLDSVVLTAKYNGTYGTFTQGQTVKVYELTESMIDSLTYYTDYLFGYDNLPIGTRTGYIPNLTSDTLTAFNGTIPSHLRIRLSDAFGNKILTADAATLTDNASFLSRFKGIYVTTTASTTGDGITYLDLSSAYSGITLFYHSGDTSSFYTMSFSGKRVNHFDQYYSSAVTSSVNSPNANGEEKMYLQAGAGVKGKIVITDLDKLPKNIAINKAEIILTQAVDNVTYTAPKYLYLKRIDDAGQSQDFEDATTLLGLISEGSTEAAGGITRYRYRFQIKNYFQKLVQGIYNNNGFYVESNVPNSNTERVVISNSATDENYQLTLVVTYTKL